MTYQEIVEAIEVLSVEDQEELFELLRKCRIETRRTEIASNAQQVLDALEKGMVKKGNFDELKTYLLEDEEE